MSSFLLHCSKIIAGSISYCILKSYYFLQFVEPMNYAGGFNFPWIEYNAVGTLQLE